MTKEQTQEKHSWQESPLAKQLGISIPLIQAPMAGGATTAELVPSS
jgi:NAD(P)H-dependent flavin oxidoreductase YrpB (nitropropane dioxygenase family)